jgi:hypothetical protein
MKKLAFSKLLVMLALSASAQGWKIDIGYDYLYTKRWDESIQTYNFSRPFLTEKQPLLMHGFTSSISYIKPNEKKLMHGFGLAHSYFRSTAENENYINTLNLHFVTIGYLLHLENKEKHENIYFDFMISARSSGIFRKLNEQPFVVDETPVRAFGIGGDLSCKMGYVFSISEKFQLSPFIKVGFTPYLFSPNTEAVINQTKNLTSPNWTSSLNGHLGISLHFKK